MIITKLQGGLGNQMFQYAISKHLAYLNNTELKLDVSVYNKQNKNATPRKYSLDCFNIVEEFATEKDIKKMNIPKMASKNIFVRIYRKIFRYFEAKKPIHKRTYINEPYFDFCEDVLKIKGDAYLSGNWQNEKYFKDIDSAIRKDFTLKKELGGYVKETLDKIANGGESVSLHIRRGDYVSSPKTNQHHGVCNLDYYQKAVNIIARETSTPIFFVFSDDIDWAKENLKTNFPTVFVSNGKLKDYEELILMSKCEHNIIANSSFSWWGAWLNQNSEKIIIAPEKWFRDSNRIKDNPCPQNWILAS